MIEVVNFSLTLLIQATLGYLGKKGDLKGRGLFSLTPLF